MGFTFTGLVLAKEDFFSNKKKEQVYQLNLFDGNKSIIQVFNVPKDIYDSVSIQDTLSFSCRVSAFVSNGSPKLIVSFLNLV